MGSNPLDELIEDAPLTNVAKMKDAIKKLQGPRDTWSVWVWVTGRIDGSPPAVFIEQTQIKDDATGDVLAFFGTVFTQRLEEKRYASYEAIASDLERASDYLPIRLIIGKA